MDRRRVARGKAHAMKIMIRNTPKGPSVYLPKKDLEEPIVEMEKEAMWGGVVKIKNGWAFELPDMPADTRLPITVNARKVGDDE
jgi:nitrogen fixation protein NifT